MLQIESISKVYKTGTLIQRALDGVSLNLRDCEFVAILGPSGSGKTTLLNILGGLDRYDSGNLIINGVSTKKYTARDWDSYRNHSVGFVFQSYNLIPHQTVLANVELALTIGGISPSERKRRALDALTRVGLKDHVHKKPAQLSGGQMQRVAIARALVNDPDILLADEPTGALDSDTSLQVMDLLKEVARDRLVVMVTHNPELAEQYATRIVRLRDGQITDDSDPFEPDAAGEGVHRNLGKASMSRLTSLSLSFNNLWTKKVRTLLVAFAGSIGIIGIAMILSMSNGVDRYIQNVEEDTLKSYPLQITDTSFNLAAFMPNSGQDTAKEDYDVREWRTVTNLFSRVSVNDLSALRAYLESGETDVYDQAQAIEYGYNLTPQIYSLAGGKVRQVNPDSSFTALGFSSSSSMSGMLSQFTSTDTFHPMPRESNLYLDQYELMAGAWPENWDECVLVLSSRGRVSDLTLYTMGLKDPDELAEMIRRFAEGSPIQETDESERTFDYEDFLGVEFRLVPASSLYTYDAEFGLWTDRSGDEGFVRKLAQQGEKLTVVGVVQPLEDASTSSLSMGICYPASLIDHLMEKAEASRIVRAQLASRDTDVFTGLKFGETRDDPGVDLSSLFTLDEDAIAEAFSFDLEDSMDLSTFDLSGLDFSGLDLAGTLDAGAFASALPSLTQADIASLLSGVRVNLSAADLRTLFAQLIAGYLVQAQQDPSSDITRLGSSMREYLNSEEAAAILQEGVQAALAENGAAEITQEELTEVMLAVLAGYPAYLEENGLGEDGDLTASLAAYLATDEARAAMAEAGADLLTRAETYALTTEQIEGLRQALAAGYETYAAEHEQPTLEAVRAGLLNYISGPEATALLTGAVSRAVDTSGLQQQAAALFGRYTSGITSAISAMLSEAMTSLTAQLTDVVTENLQGMTEQMGEKLQEAFQLDPEALFGAFSMNMDANELRDLLSALMSRQENSWDGNLRKLGYASVDAPSSVTIYPKDFQSKAAIKAILEAYNTSMEQSGQDEKIITYTDVVDTLMSSVTEIVDAISTVLIAFVAISLVVSSVMIGVITYISVLERRKEIGILRAIGASKRNISQVFNAETFIIGALAGLLGVGITWILLIPANRIIASLAGNVQIRAYLPVSSAAILVVLSVVLTLLGGLIPSRKAARQDPVAALRSE